MKAALQTLLIVAVLVAIFIFVAVRNEVAEAPASISDRIEKACNEEFRYAGETRIAECKTQTLMRHVIEAEREKMNNSYSRSR